VGQKHGPNAGHTRQRGMPKTQSKHANMNPRGENEMYKAHQIRILTIKKTKQGCGHNSADRRVVFPGITSESFQPLSDHAELVS